MFGRPGVRCAARRIDASEAPNCLRLKGNNEWGITKPPLPNQVFPALKSGSLSHGRREAIRLRLSIAESAGPEAEYTFILRIRL
jgi:hypothetical protein